jgi:CRISPR-associated protein Cas2
LISDFAAMYILITYDVSTTTPIGKSRLRRAAKTCLDYGQRVQNSVFECKVDPAQLVALKQRLLDIINPETDSLRFYHLGTNWEHKVEHHGTNPGYNIEGPLIV